MSYSYWVLEWCGKGDEELAKLRDSLGPRIPLSEMDNLEVVEVR